MLDGWSSRSTSSTRCDSSGPAKRGSSSGRRAGCYRVFSRLTQVKLEHNAGDFRLLDRAVLVPLLSMREHHRFLRGMTAWVGFSQSAICHTSAIRGMPVTKYTLRKMVAFSLDAISSFSYVPLQLATALGFLFALTAFAAIPVIIVLRLLHHYLPGFGAITIIILMFGGDPADLSRPRRRVPRSDLRRGEDASALPRAGAPEPGC